MKVNSALLLYAAWGLSFKTVQLSRLSSIWQGLLSSSPRFSPSAAAIEQDVGDELQQPPAVEGMSQKRGDEVEDGDN